MGASLLKPIRKFANKTAPLRLAEILSARPLRRIYLGERAKFVVALSVAFAWTGFSGFLAQPWLHDLAALTNELFAIWALTFIAFVPGFMNAFLATSLLLDRRPARRPCLVYPGVSLLVAAYNEAAGIGATLARIAS